MTPWLALIAGDALHAVITSLLGLSMITAGDSLLILGIAAAASTLLGGLVAGRSGASIPGVVGTRLPANRALWWLNMWTAVTFVAFFLGVAIYGAAVVFTLGATIAPLAVTAWAGFQANRVDGMTRPSAAQWWAVGLLAVLGGALVVVLAGSGSRGIAALLVASVLGVIDGVAAGGVAIVSRGLGSDGFSVWQVMAHRFYATVLVTAVALLVLVPAGLLAAPRLSAGMAIGAAFASLVVPFFFMQYAIQRLSPVLVTGTLALVPAIALVVEVADGRAASWPALALALLIVPASLAILATQHKSVAVPPPSQPRQWRTVYARPFPKSRSGSHPHAAQSQQPATQVPRSALGGDHAGHGGLLRVPGQGEAQAGRP